MTDHPILFQPNMIEALRQRGKTQTRRAPNTKNTLIDGRGWQRGEFDQLDWQAAWLDKGPSPAGNAGPYLKVPHLNGDTVHRVYPRVQFNDRFWVKEAHFALGRWVKKSELKKNGQPKMKFVQNPCEPVRFVEPDHALRFPRDTTFGWYPRNSLFMSRADSRTTLWPVVNVRFQRLNELSINDAMSEGIEKQDLEDGYTGFKDYSGHPTAFEFPIQSFRTLIISINGPEIWAENRWVLAYSFGVDHRNIDRA